MEALLIDPNYRNLPDQKQLIVSNQYLNMRKNKSIIYLLLVFLGGVGAHHYYMGNIIAGIFYTIFCWTFIPSICAFFELFCAYKYVDNYNQKLLSNLICINSQN